MDGKSRKKGIVIVLTLMAVAVMMVAASVRLNS